MDEEERKKADAILEEMKQMSQDTRITKNRCVNFSMDLTLIETEYVSKLIEWLRNK